MVARVLVLSLLVAGAGCQKRSELYCGANPEDLANCPQTDAPVPPMMACQVDGDCTSPAKPLCSPDSHTCVGCLLTNPGYCAMQDPQKPNCDPGTLTCRGCLTNSDCTSNACLPGTGVCAEASTLIYVNSDSGDDAGGHDGTMTKPLKTITKALTFVMGSRNVIRLSGAAPYNEAVVIMAKNVIILADPGTKVIAKADPAIKISGSQATIVGLELECPSSQKNGVKCDGKSTARLVRMNIHGCPKTGLDAADGYIELSQSTVADNGDGIVIGTATFSIVNDFIVHNGSTTAMHGGVDLGAINPACHLEFNTIAHNQASATSLKGPAVTCPSLSNFPIPNNLIIANTGPATGATLNCDASGSKTDPDPTAYQFTQITTAPYNYHLKTGSEAIDMALTPSLISDDVDGNFRPQGMQKDLGADEYLAPPP